MTMRVLVLRFELVSKGMQLPALAGSVWHGGLGAVLHENSPLAFDRLYQTDDEARLYSLVAPPGGAWPAREARWLQVSLFGPACQFGLALMQAVVRLGVVGLRPGGSFVVARIESVALDDSGGGVLLYTAEAGLVCPPVAVDLQAAWAGAVDRLARLNGFSLAVGLLSPLRIKEKNQELRVAPTGVQLLRRVLGRVDQLAHASGLELAWLRAGRADWLNLAAGVVLAEADMGWCGTERRSARSGQVMNFGGLMGCLVYAQVPPPVAAWLLLAQGVQVGGKTAFGFGGVAVDVVDVVPASVVGAAAGVQGVKILNSTEATV